MANLGDMTVKIVGDTTGLNKSLAASKKAATDAGKSFADLAKDIAGFTTIYDLAVDAGKAFVRMIKDTAVKAVTLAMSMERTQMEFSVLTGNFATGNKLLAEFNKLGAETPLELQDIVASGKQLLSVGVNVNKVTDTIRMLGDVAMGSPEKLQRLTEAFGQLRSKGVASMETLNRFIEAGVPIMSELGKITGASTAEIFKMVSLGKIGFKEVEQALKNVTGAGGLFENMMAKVATTAEGKWSTAIDNMNARLRRMGTEALPMVNAALDTFNAKMDKSATVDNISDVLKGTVTSAEGVRQALIDIQNGISDIEKGKTKDQYAQASLYLYKQQLETIKKIHTTLQPLWAAQESAAKLQADADRIRAEDAANNAAKAAADAIDDSNAFDIAQNIAANALKNRSDAMNDYYAKMSESTLLWYASATEGAIEHIASLSENTVTVSDNTVTLAANMKLLLGAEGDAFSPDIVGKVMAINNKLGDLSKTILGISEYWNSAQGMLSAYGDLQDNRSAKEEKDIQDKIDAAKLAGEDTKALEDELLAKRNENRKKDFENEKAMQLASIVINTASAIVKALPNIPFAIAIGAMGAIQAALVASKEYIPLAQGGIITPKPGGTQALLAEAGQAEAVIPLDRLDRMLATQTGSSSDGGMTRLVVNLDSRPLLDKIFDATRNRTVLISQGAVV